MYEFTCQLATLEPPAPELEALLTAAGGSQEAMDGFARMSAGVTSPADYFADDNVGRILASARVEAPALGAIESLGRYGRPCVRSHGSSH